MTPTPNSGGFTLETARVILSCRDLYTHDKVIDAARWMVGCVDADRGDLELATGLLGFGWLRHLGQLIR